MTTPARRVLRWLAFPVGAMASLFSRVAVRLALLSNAMYAWPRGDEYTIVDDDVEEGLYADVSGLRRGLIDAVNRQVADTVERGDGVSLTSAAHPQADLNEASLEAAIVELHRWCEDRGKRIAIVPTHAVYRVAPNGDVVPPVELIAAQHLPRYTFVTYPTPDGWTRVWGDAGVHEMARQTYADVGAHYAEALARSRRTSKWGIEDMVLAGWTHHEIKHYIDSDEQPPHRARIFEDASHD